MPPATTETTVPEQNTQSNQSTVKARVTKRTPADRTSVGQVQASDLATPPPQIQLQNVPPPTIPNRTIQTEQNVRQQADGIIRADTEESRQLKQLQNESAALGLDSRGIFEREQQKLGVNKNVRELQDINLQLNDLEKQSGLSQVAIAGGAGQTVGQAQRELTQEDQEFAVRSAGLAARSAILQNSIETGRALAKDAALFATQDVDFKSKQLRAQIDSLSGTVDQQTQQLLDQQKRELDLQDQKSAELRDSIEKAIVSGASQFEISQFSDPYLDQDTKLDIARKAIGRTARTDIQQQQTLRGLQIRSESAQAAVREAELQLMQDAAKDRAEAVARGELLPEQAEIVDKIDKDFRSEPVVKAYNEAAQKRFAFENVIDGGVKGVQDLTLIYEFMKALDPDSVVRDFEAEMAAGSGNIFEGKWAKYNGYFDEGQTLPESVKNEFIETIDSTWQGTQQQYFNIKNQFGIKVDRMLGTQGGAQYLTAYEAGAPLSKEDIEIANVFGSASSEDVADIMRMVNELSTSQ